MGRGEGQQRAWFREHLESRAQRLVAVAAGITTVIGVPLAINALIDTFWRDNSVAVAPSATLALAEPEFEQTWGDFRDRYPTEFPRGSYSRRQLETPGLVLPVRITVTGLADKKATLRWEARNPTGVVGNFDPPSWVPQTREIRPSSSPAHETVHVWVPPAPELDEEIVRFTLIDDRGDEIAQEESRRFQIEQ
jgi:hypothetical protein